MSQQPSTPVKVPSSAANYSPATLDPDLRSQVNTILLRDGHVTKYVLSWGVVYYATEGRYQHSRALANNKLQNPRTSPTLPQRQRSQLAYSASISRPRTPPLWRGTNLPRPPSSCSRRYTSRVVLLNNNKEWETVQWRQGGQWNWRVSHRITSCSESCG